MNDYWYTAMWILTVLGFVASIPATVICVLVAVYENDWRGVVGANICALIGTLCLAWGLTYGG